MIFDLVRGRFYGGHALETTGARKGLGDHRKAQSNSQLEAELNWPQRVTIRPSESCEGNEWCKFLGWIKVTSSTNNTVWSMAEIIFRF